MQVVKHRLRFPLAPHAEMQNPGLVAAEKPVMGQGIGEQPGAAMLWGGHTEGHIAKVLCSPQHLCSVPRGSCLAQGCRAAGVQHHAPPPNSFKNALLRQGLFGFHLSALLGADEGAGGELNPSPGVQPPQLQGAVQAQGGLQ